MKSLEEQVRELAHDEEVSGQCPRCGCDQWWSRSTPATHTGPLCVTGCGYRLRLSTAIISPELHHGAPPVILCSRCGEALALGDGAYRCEPCGRTVP